MIQNQSLLIRKVLKPEQFAPPPPAKKENNKPHEIKNHIGYKRVNLEIGVFSNFFLGGAGDKSLGKNFDWIQKCQLEIYGNGKPVMPVFRRKS